MVLSSCSYTESIFVSSLHTCGLAEKNKEHMLDGFLLPILVSVQTQPTLAPISPSTLTALADGQRFPQQLATGQLSGPNKHGGLARTLGSNSCIGLAASGFSARPPEVLGADGA